MKKTFTYLRTLLVGLMAVTATGTAWADLVPTNESCDFENSETLLTASGRMTGENATDPTDATNNVYKFTTASNAGNAAPGGFGYYDFSSLTNTASKVDISFDCFIPQASGQVKVSFGDATQRVSTIFGKGAWGYSSTGAIFAFGSERGKLDGKNNENYAKVNNTSIGSTTALKANEVLGLWVSVSATVDITNKTISYVLKNKSTDTELVSATDEAFLDPAATVCTQLDIQSGVNSISAYIDNLSITSYTDASEKFANYTIQYKFGETSIKPDRIVESVKVGNTTTIIESDKNAIWYGEPAIKYIYESDDADSQTVAEDGSAVVTVTFREAATYSYTVVSNADVTLNSGSGFEGESPRVAYPRYQKDGIALYMAAVDNKEYRTTVNLTEDNVSKTVNYELQDGKEVAYYIEGEDITGMTLATNDNIPVRASNAKAAKSNEDVEITTLPAGKYKLHVGIFTSKTGYAGNKVNFGIGAEVFNAEFTGVNLNEIESEEYTINATTSIKYLGSTSWGGAEFDYIWIEKTGDAEEISSVEATVGEAGWATYIAPYALDFSGVDGLTAYTATVSENTVTLTEVDNVPAGTGVVLKGATNTYNIPIIDSSETAKGDLKGSISKDTTADGTQYILTKTGSNAQFAPATAASTIAAGKAYLVVAGGGASRLNVVIAGETTGIKAIEAQEAQEGIYNLQGQRVAKAQKGLYIVNGKKAIVK